MNPKWEMKWGTDEKSETCEIKVLYEAIIGNYELFDSFSPKHNFKQNAQMGKQSNWIIRKFIDKHNALYMR